MLTALTALRFRENGKRREIRPGETFEVEDAALREDLLRSKVVVEKAPAQPKAVPPEAEADLPSALDEDELRRRNLLDQARALKIKGIRANTSTAKLREKIDAALAREDTDEDTDEDGDEDAEDDSEDEEDDKVL